MTRGLSATFELLGSTENEAAAGVLLVALDSPDAWIREQALRAILERRSPTGMAEIVRRLHRIEPHWKPILAEHASALAPALRAAVLDPDAQTCANGCEAAVEHREYDLIPTLVSALEDQANPHAPLAAATLLSLAESLDAELDAPRDYRRRRDPNLIRRHALRSLEQSLRRYGSHRRIEPVEAFLMLVERGDATLKQILLDPLHTAYLPVMDVLTHSQRPAIMRLVINYLHDSHAPTAIINVVSRRGDLKFVNQLLRRVGGEPSPAVQWNLKRLDRIAWLDGDPETIFRLDDAGQYSAVQALMSSGINRIEAFHILKNVLASGKAPGRRAAAAALVEFKGAEANALVLERLDDDDPQIQAQFARQLRRRGIAGALNTLLKLVDSPHSVVREAARESLAEFNFKRYLAAFDMLDDDVRASTGALVAKIDPTTLVELREELASPSPRRRIRALEAADVTGLGPRIEEQAVELLGDDDHMVRARAAQVLAQCDGEAARAALKLALEDPSPKVRELAAESLALVEESIGIAAASDSSAVQPTEEPV